MTVKGLAKCCISIAVDGTDGNMLCNCSEGEMNVRCECEENDGTDREDGDSDAGW